MLTTDIRPSVPGTDAPPVTHGESVPGANRSPAGPILLALAAGVLAQAARISLRVAFRGLRTRRLLLSRPAAATTIAAIVTALAVYAAG